MRGSELSHWTPASRWLAALLVSSAVAAQAYVGLVHLGASPSTGGPATAAGENFEHSMALCGTRLARRGVLPGMRGDDRAQSRTQALALLLLAEGGRAVVLR